MSAIVDQLTAGIRTQGDKHGIDAAYAKAYNCLCDVVENAPHLAGEAVDAFDAVLVRLHALSAVEATAAGPLVFVDSVTGEPCPTQGNLLCAIPYGGDHLHLDQRATGTEAPVPLDQVLREIDAALEAQS